MLVNSKESCIPLQSQCFGLGGGPVLGYWGFVEFRVWGGVRSLGPRAGLQLLTLQIAGLAQRPRPMLPNRS